MALHPSLSLLLLYLERVVDSFYPPKAYSLTLSLGLSLTLKDKSIGKLGEMQHSPVISLFKLSQLPCGHCSAFYSVAETICVKTPWDCYRKIGVPCLYPVLEMRAPPRAPPPQYSPSPSEVEIWVKYFRYFLSLKGY